MSETELKIIADGEIATEASEDTVADDSETLAAPSGILHNKHDVQRLIKKCEQLHGAIAKHGAMVDQVRLHDQAQSFAVARILVLKGICTEAEMNGEVFSRMALLLEGALQQVEEQSLQRGKPQVQRVEKPKLLVATH